MKRRSKKLLRDSAASVLFVVSLGIATGTAQAAPAPGAGQVGSATSASTPLAGNPLIRPVVDKQTAQDNLMREIEIGWANGGSESALMGAGIGFVVGCISVFPAFIAGCTIGAGVGAAIGAINGITAANPDAEPAFYEWLNAAP
ncbi:hypothetical protein [Rhodococcus spongiicola]|uniref:Glycine zipper family protein n=1 Tax=Rhodococcus spongiicola TaxID=2487352 RepID=A0A438AYF0_9NOCA|nr:hypothetical protein [Rhodococcus spongiicola]RVW03708.1 hypothetical protein EF834_08900 [Rhodococcus spongiicola]